MRYEAEVELTRHLHPSVCVLTAAADRLCLTLHWLVYTRVKPEVIPDEVFGGTPYWTTGLIPGTGILESMCWGWTSSVLMSVQ